MVVRPTRSPKNRLAAEVRTSIHATGIISQLVSIYIFKKIFSFLIGKFD
jgi:hypothetical protein